MTEQRAESREQKIRAVGALRDGIARVNRAPVIVACVFLVTLLAALPFSMMMRDALQAHLGNSMVAEQVAQGVNVQWWSEFTGTGRTTGQDVPARHHRLRRGARQPQRVRRRRGATLTACVARRLLPGAVALPGGRRSRPLRARAPDAIVRVLHGVRRLLRALFAAGAVHRARLLRSLCCRASAAPRAAVRRSHARRHEWNGPHFSSVWRCMRSSARCWCW